MNSQLEDGDCLGMLHGLSRRDGAGDQMGRSLNNPQYSTPQGCTRFHSTFPLGPA